MVQYLYILDPEIPTDVMMDKHEPNMDKHGMIMETTLKTLDPKHVSCFEGF